MVRPPPLQPRSEMPRTLSEVLGRIREDPSFPAMAADWLSSAFGDRKSYSGFLARSPRRGSASCGSRSWCRYTIRRWVRRRRIAGRCSCTRCRVAPATVNHSSSVLPGGPGGVRLIRAASVLLRSRSRCRAVRRASPKPRYLEFGRWSRSERAVVLGRTSGRRGVDRRSRRNVRPAELPATGSPSYQG